MLKNGQKPVCGGANLGRSESKYLGVRPIWDVDLDDAGNVDPAKEKHGISTFADPAQLTKFKTFRPPSLNGMFPGAIFTIEESVLPVDLQVTPKDTPPSGHLVIGPTKIVHVNAFLQSLHSTCDLWVIAYD
jgi:hypothetical protein